MSKIVVIGGTGTVSSQTVQELVKRGAEVRVMTRSSKRSEQKPKQVHHVMLLSHLPCGREGRILLKSQQDRILARDSLIGTKTTFLRAS